MFHGLVRYKYMGAMHNAILVIYCVNMDQILAWKLLTGKLNVDDEYWMTGFAERNTFSGEKVPWIARKSLGFRNDVEISVERQHIKICRTMDHLIGGGKLLTVQLLFIYMPWLILRINCLCPPGDSQLLSCRVFEIDMQPGRNELVSEIWHIRTHQNWVAFCVQGSRVS